MLEAFRSEVQQQANLQFAGFEISNQLGLVKGRQAVDGLQFENHFVVNDEVQKIVGDYKAFVAYHYPVLRIKGKLAKGSSVSSDF